MTFYEKHIFILSFFKNNKLDYILFDKTEKIYTESFSDIDIIVSNSFKLEEFIRYFIRQSCKVINIINNDGYDQIYMMHSLDNTLFHVDLIFNQKIRGMTIESTDEYFKSRLYSKNNIYFINEVSLCYYELLKSLIFSQKIPKKYFTEILNNYKEIYQDAIIKNYGNNFNDNILKLLSNKKCNYNFQFNFIKYSILNNPKNLFNLIYHYFFLIKRYLNYPGLYIYANKINNFKVTNELFTGVIYIEKPKNIFSKIKNTMKLIKARGEIKLIISESVNTSFLKPDIFLLNGESFDIEILAFMNNRIKDNDRNIK